MAFWKRRSRGSFAPSSHDRVAVNYLGRHPVVDNTDLEHTATPLDILYRNYKDGKEQAQRVTVEVIINGLVISMLKGFSPPSESSASFSNRTILPASKMYVGATDPARPKIFFVVKRRDDDATDDTTTSGKYECHAFLCDTPAIANSLTVQLMETFNHSVEDEIKLAYRRSLDMMQRSQQQASRDKVLGRSQSLNLPRSRGRQEPVSMLKVTRNVDHGFKNSNEGNNNSEIARILAKRDGDQAPVEHGYSNKIATDSAPQITATTEGGSSGIIPPEMNDPVPTTFTPTHPDPSPPVLLRQSHLSPSPVQEQSPKASPKPSPKQSPKDNPRNISAENTKENQEVVEKEQKEARKKAVRFADDAEII
ncbi:uncharacterized protein LOC117290903 [Asterias rubens]|uniref:uncharacterized protein LOC117290903 n=1 Tax=Asterias rubens TaxID=7604 RepID=UPI0014553C74|nr:uncharacterized protein LOC117290903 [Asterias rubens]